MRHEPRVHVVDDDAAVRDSLQWLMDSVGIPVSTYDSAQAFLAASDQAAGCVLLDVRLRDQSGLELHRRLKDQGFRLPIIFITGYGDIAMAVEAMKNGAADFVTKPFDDQRLLETVQRAMAAARESAEKDGQREQVRRRLEALSPRERQVLDRVVAGKLNKTIADELNISAKTVEAHRAHLMEKMQARNVAELLRQVAFLEIP